jgi:hypothetical protein
MTVAGLRREIAKGRLAVEMIAGKQFTTLAATQRMRELCTVVVKAKQTPRVMPCEESSNSNSQERLRLRLALLRKESRAKRAAKKRSTTPTDEEENADRSEEKSSKK